MAWRRESRATAEARSAPLKWIGEVLGHGSDHAFDDGGKLQPAHGEGCEAAFVFDAWADSQCKEDELGVICRSH